MKGNPVRLVRLAKWQQRAGALEHPPYQNPHGTAENAVSPLGLTGRYDRFIMKIAFAKPRVPEGPSFHE